MIRNWLPGMAQRNAKGRLPLPWRRRPILERLEDRSLLPHLLKWFAYRRNNDE
jgi:hypothetical protein